jgi:hypothetical protein
MSNELSNFDIIDIIKDLKLDHCFGGVYSKDQLPKDLMRTKFYIVNMQDHDEGNGTHWIVFYYIKPLTSIFFDSFGFPPPEDIDEVIKPYIYNDAEVQDYKSRACGYFCIAFIKFLHSKQEKQEAKLTIAGKKRLQTSRTYTLTINNLPTKYTGNAVTDNANVGGLVAGRPWS